MVIKFDLEEIKKDVKSLIAEISEISVDNLGDDARFFEDLGIDSMRALEIVASIEKKYKLIIPEEDIPKIRSLRSIYDLLDRIFKK
jgi:acyl carrier protein